MTVDRAVKMARDFHSHNNPPWPFLAEDMRQTLSAMDYLKVSETGFIAGVLQPLPISREWIVASEFLWWRDPHLIRGFRRWAMQQGANEIRYSCPHGSPVEGFYKTISRPSEVVYSELTSCA